MRPQIVTLIKDIKTYLLALEDYIYNSANTNMTLSLLNYNKLYGKYPLPAQKGKKFPDVDILKDQRMSCCK